MSAAAFKAVYSDMKLVRTRSVAQVVLEIPIEQTKAFIDAFGVPVPGKETWCAIARLDLTKAASEAAKAEKPARKWEHISPAQQAGIRCEEKPFRVFLVETIAQEKSDLNEEEAAEAVRAFCGVMSRSDIGKTERSSNAWHKLDTDYQFWLRDSR